MLGRAHILLGRAKLSRIFQRAQPTLLGRAQKVLGRALLCSGEHMFARASKTYWKGSKLPEARARASTIFARASTPLDLSRFSHALSTLGQTFLSTHKVKLLLPLTCQYT